MKNALLRLTGTVSGVGALAAILLPAAGKVNVPAIWRYLGATALMSAVGLARMDPGLIRERFKPGPGKWDRVVGILIGPMYLAHLIVAGLDIGRFHWSGTVSKATRLLGFLAYVGGNALALWAMIANPFFSPKIRLQTERGQHVIAEGPYAHIRHPGYAGATIMLLGSGLALGSWLAVIPAIGVIAGLLWRIRGEERFLKAELSGYADYAQRVRYRLVPGVW